MACVRCQLFDISKKDIDNHLSAEDYLFVQDRKGPCKSIYGGKELKQLKRQLSKQELIKKKEGKHHKLSKNC